VLLSRGERACTALYTTIPRAEALCNGGGGGGIVTTANGCRYCRTPGKTCEGCWVKMANSDDGAIIIFIRNRDETINGNGTKMAQDSPWTGRTNVFEKTACAVRRRWLCCGGCDGYGGSDGGVNKLQCQRAPEPPPEPPLTLAATRPRSSVVTVDIYRGAI